MCKIMEEEFGAVPTDILFTCEGYIKMADSFRSIAKTDDKIAMLGLMFEDKQIRLGVESEINVTFNPGDFNRGKGT